MLASRADMCVVHYSAESEGGSDGTEASGSRRWPSRQSYLEVYLPLAGFFAGEFLGGETA
jgi:hypothetical protein